MPPHLRAAAWSARRRFDPDPVLVLQHHARPFRRRGIRAGWSVVLIISGGAALPGPTLGAQSDSSVAVVAPAAASPAPAHDPIGQRILQLAPAPFGAAAGGQILGTPEKWARTWRGYGNRVGDQIGFLLVEESVRHGMMAVLPWQPVRPVCGVAGKGQPFVRQVIARVGCSVRTTTTMQTVSGDTRPNLPFAVGLVTATAASLTWRPERASAAKARGFVAQRLAISLGATIGMNALFPAKPD